MTVNTAGEISPSGLGIGRLRAFWRRLGFLAPRIAREWLAADAKQLAVWTPVAIGAGAGLYFGLKSEPMWIFAVAALAATGFLALQGGRVGKIGFALLLIALGYGAAEWRAARVAAPILARELSIRDVSGRIVAVEESADARRIILALTAIKGVPAEKTPARARITWRGEGFEAKPGDLVSLRAGLGPPPPPAAPGTFDFARQLYFQRIGAVGFAVSPPAVAEAGPATIATWVETARLKLFRRIMKAAPNENGAIVAAIVTGKRDAVTQEAQAALRDAGLAHLLAISGLHMGLAMGAIFFVLRLGFAAIEPIALNYPVKKWAAAAALISGFAYLILSGGGLSARRAFIMAAIMFAAILADRRALSLRNVAIAATIILLTTPEALFHPGFQMSFAAVTALIAGYEWMSRRADPMRSFSLAAQSRRYVVGLAATDIIAALATAPYALYHFNRVALYSLPANIVAVPLMGFWIIPAAIVALLLAPFGLDGWAWRLSADGVGVVLDIAEKVSDWPGAVSLTSQWPLAAMLALTLGGLWLCLARSPLRLAGLVGVPVAWLIVALAPTPEVFVAASGLNAGVVLKDGGMAVYSDRRDRFSVSVWKEAAGLEPAQAQTVPMKDAGTCDGSGCVVALLDGKRAAFIEDPSMLAEDCARADLVVAFFPASVADWRACAAPLIDRRSVWKRGAHAAWVGKDGRIKIRSVAETRGRRPWTDAAMGADQ